MRNPNPELIERIKATALDMLMKKDPGEIGMRDIASKCGVTATSIYHYFKDKDRLFQAVSLDCLYELNERIKESSEKGRSIKSRIRNAVSTFRDWCFENPRRSLLVMQGIKSADDASPELIEEYYVCNRTGERLLKEAMAEGSAKSTDPRLDVSILVSGIWGCIESVLLKKCEPEYWNDGMSYTERFIKMWCKSIFLEEKK